MKHVILMIFICAYSTTLIYGQLSTLKNDRGISEIITSTQLKIKNNAILFFDSEVLSKNCQSKYIWYKIVFSEKMKFSLCLIPNVEKDIYTMDGFRVNNNLSLCDSNSIHNPKIQNFIYKKSYTDNQQSETFRSTILYSNEVAVEANEAIYILISNKSGVDRGHLLDLKTSKAEYLFKATKDTSSALVSCQSQSLDSIFHNSAFNILKKTICKDQLNTNLCGMIKFQNNEMCEANYTKQDIKMIMNHQEPLKSSMVINAKSSKNSKKEADTRPIVAMNSNSAKNNTIESVLKKPDSMSENTVPSKVNDTKITNKLEPLAAAKTSSINVANSKNKEIQSSMNKKTNALLNASDTKNNDVLSCLSSASTATNSITSTKNNQNKPDLNPIKINLQKANDSKITKDGSQVVPISESSTINSVIEQNKNQPELNSRNNEFSKESAVKKHNYVVSSYKYDTDKKADNTIITQSVTNSKIPENKNLTNSSDISLIIKLPSSSNDNVMSYQIPSIRNNSNGEYLNLTNLNSKNEFELNLKKNESYEIEINQLGYKKYKQTIQYLPNDTANQLLIIKLIPLDEGDVFVAKNITFHPNTPVFKKQSESELQKLVLFLKECPHIYISIEGHTNGNNKIPEEKERSRMGGQWAFHGSSKELSIERAKVIQSYLVENGVDINRLDIKGFGGSKPIYDIKDTDISYKNMRVEIRIIKSSDKIIMSKK